MDDLISPNRAWNVRRPWTAPLKAPPVVVLAGIGSSGIVDAALGDPGLADHLLVRWEPDCAPPCDATLWRLETASGEGLNTLGLLTRIWHRPPYALTVRLVCYQPRSSMPEIIDEGTIGTRGPRAAFLASVDRLAMRLVRDAALGRSRGLSGTAPAAAPHGPPGWLGHLRNVWNGRLTTEWWSVGSTAADIPALLAGKGLGPIHWYAKEAGERYLADPFPWPGTSMVLCEDMPRAGGVGRIVAVSEAMGRLSAPVFTVLEDGRHHSYPCTFLVGDTLYCVPESTERGATLIHKLTRDGGLTEVCEVAPHARLADPTLFAWDGRYWIACTDLDIGAHDNLCLLHASSISGPWTPHVRWPVKIDIRGARPAGTVFMYDGRLFRPAQDCAETYGAAVALQEVIRLSASDFAEKTVTVLRPDPKGPFPRGLHTLSLDGDRFWIDGKRFVRDLSLARAKLERRLGFQGRERTEGV